MKLGLREYKRQAMRISPLSEGGLQSGSLCHDRLTSLRSRFDERRVAAARKPTRCIFPVVPKVIAGPNRSAERRKHESGGCRIAEMGSTRVDHRFQVKGRGTDLLIHIRKRDDVIARDFFEIPDALHHSCHPLKLFEPAHSQRHVDRQEQRGKRAGNLDPSGPLRLVQAGPAERLKLPTVTFHGVYPFNSTTSMPIRDSLFKHRGVA